MGFILSQLIKKRVPEWNETIFTEETLTAAAKANGARVVTQDIKSKGEYTIYRDVPFLVVRRNLRSQLRPWVIAHELGHHLLHALTNHKFSKSTIRRFDREANFFAAIALIPTRELPFIGELAEERGYPKQLIKIRMEIYEAYRI